MFKWPDAETVHGAARSWAEEQAQLRPEVLRIGYIGSYARGGWGVGSDLDLVAVVAESDEPFERRAAAWDTGALPVPTDVLVYTTDEWRALLASGGRFARVLREEAVWLYDREDCR